MTKEYALRKAQKRREWADAAEAKAKTLLATFHRQYKSFDWTQPILRGHHSQRRHEKVFEHRDSVMRHVIELETKAKMHRAKADNLEQFANTYKGDAERRRQAERDANDAMISVGSKVYDFCFHSGDVVRVNRKSYTIRFASGATFARDKSYVKPI